MSGSVHQYKLQTTTLTEEGEEERLTYADVS
jgi:hypothetical protein